MGNTVILNSTIFEIDTTAFSPLLLSDGGLNRMSVHLKTLMDM